MNNYNCTQQTLTSLPFRSELSYNKYETKDINMQHMQNMKKAGVLIN